MHVKIEEKQRIPCPEDRSVTTDRCEA